jgi:hypothetical protein
VGGITVTDTIVCPKCNFEINVWVTSRACLLGVAAAMRAGLIETARTRRSLQGWQSKVECLFQYLSGTEFRQRMEGIIEAFVTLQTDLESEKRSMQRLWNKRAKQIGRAMCSTVGLYGDVGGILGPSLPPIPALELTLAAPDSDAISVSAADTAVDESPF